MISPKYHQRNKSEFQNVLKLPEIPSKKQMPNQKKIPVNNIALPLPNIKNERKNLSLNKENKPENVMHRKNSIEDQIKARVLDIEAAQKIVKNVLGGPQQTIQLGGDMTNFQVKIQHNRQLIRKYRNKTQFRQEPKEIFQVKENESQVEHKPKSVSSKQNGNKQLFSLGPSQDLKIKIHENHENLHLNNRKLTIDTQHKQDIKNKYKSERKMKKRQNTQINQGDSKIFKSIKQILQDPQKAVGQHQKKLKNVKFTIQQLQDKLKKLNRIQFNQSNLEGYQNMNERNDNDSHKLVGVKSVGMIPICDAPLLEQYTIKNWNRINFSVGKKENQQTEINNSESNKIQKDIKYHKSDFDTQMDHIKKLQLRSYKSIQKMVQNKKLLIDLKLLNNKHKSALFTQKNERKNDLEMINEIKYVKEQ